MAKFILSAFADEIDADLSVQLTHLRKNDIAYMECRNIGGQCVIDYDNAQVKAFAQQMADSGVQVSALGSPVGKYPITEPFAPHLDRFKRAMEVAHLLGTPNIRMFSFFIPKGETPEQYRGEVMQRWEGFLQAAQGEGLLLLHENERDIYGENAQCCKDLLDTMASPLLKGIFDPANFVLCGVETWPAFELLRDQIVYLHIKDGRFADGKVVPAGQGDGKIKEILQALKEEGFEGFLSIEPHLVNNMPGAGPELFTVAVEALREVLAELH